MNFALAVRQAVAGSLARYLPTVPTLNLADTIAQDTTILAANRIEAFDSPLCDCRRDVNPPRDWKSHKFIEHHCDCAAVRTARIILGGITRTLHAEQCPGCK